MIDYFALVPKTPLKRYFWSAVLEANYLASLPKSPLLETIQLLERTFTVLTLSPLVPKTPLSGIIIIEHTFSVLTKSLALLKVKTITFWGDWDQCWRVIEF